MVNEKEMDNFINMFYEKAQEQGVPITKTQIGDLVRGSIVFANIVKGAKSGAESLTLNFEELSYIAAFSDFMGLENQLHSLMHMKP